ncbi:hypothetical protein H5410_050360 [Solanum commersonii]|uniref:Uncharacterized protein n=1 Tax=Solanum commersonii TaxID=4109 RepID=A0A9J5WWU9_SOLCO|nr:hypothetical protein H5410_050360 [Solanum commersonii]
MNFALKNGMRLTLLDLSKVIISFIRKKGKPANVVLNQDMAKTDFGVPIWHCDRLIHLTGTLDIGLIRDGANVVAPSREPQNEVPPLGADLADMAEQAHGGDLIIPDHTDTVPTSSSQAASRAPSSSRSTPPSRAAEYKFF